MRRRESIGFVGSTAAWSLAARAQQRAVGFLDPAAESKNPHAFNRGPADTGHVAGRSVTGIGVFSAKLAAQRPALLRELVPPAARAAAPVALPMRRVRSSR